MRKLNMFLVIGILATFLAHSIMGAMRLMGGGADALKIVAWACVGLIGTHVIVTGVMTWRTLRAMRRAGAGYFRDNLMFWARRISGFAMLIPLIMHFAIFSAASEGAYRLKAFTTGRLVSQLLLILCMALHIITNVRPMLIGMGVQPKKALRADILLVLSAVLLCLGAAFLIYYVRWMRV